MEQIQYIGLEQLNDEEKGILKQLSTEYNEKIKRTLKDETTIIIQIKEHKKVGDRKKYSLHLRVKAQAKSFETEKIDWELTQVIHESFKDLERQIQHKLHTDDQENKPRMKAKTQSQQR
jgi:hypothetical protein